MRNLLGLELFFFTWLVCSNAQANEKNQEYKNITVMAPVSCDTWLKNILAEKSADASNLTNTLPIWLDRRWALGLATGLNSASTSTNDLLSNVDSQVVFDWVQEYCKKNEKEDVYRAVVLLISHLRNISEKKR